MQGQPSVGSQQSVHRGSKGSCSQHAESLSPVSRDTGSLAVWLKEDWQHHLAPRQRTAAVPASSRPQAPPDEGEEEALKAFNTLEQQLSADS